MRYNSLETFLKTGKAALARGPVAMVFVEDLVEVDTTIRHHRRLGFRQMLVFAPVELELPDKLDAEIHRIDYDMAREQALETAVNAVIAAAPGLWLYYCYNAEYLFYPFSETRTIGEMLTFQTEERRDSVLTYVIDLYADDLEEYPNAVSLEDAHLDRSGYYALARPDPDNHNHPKERQLNFYGGLRWRFEEHIPEPRRKIDRISIFRAKPGLKLRDDHTFNDEEYNTYACPWHHNITVAIGSFRTAKALKTNAGSTFDIQTFTWHNSTDFEWHSQQLLDLGLMEPGQWF
ncbi:glycosyltransferase family 2 protein [Frigidibacter sp. ROC022]|uniref:glycosyltransferase family 2 protein n=1 Tax=Frigidibacter sp. ROC022 TaxID=2971796 RepID=UPI00215A5F9C|nr:glycosyltransferase family 2 protein [Frigidibacter sp. ROC022]MCR8722812.1 glycosyltransferase family 2 protein [Frigidibacter sp. ROC022]